MHIFWTTVMSSFASDEIQCVLFLIEQPLQFRGRVDHHMHYHIFLVSFGISLSVKGASATAQHLLVLKVLHYDQHFCSTWWLIRGKQCGLRSDNVQPPSQSHHTQFIDSSTWRTGRRHLTPLAFTLRDISPSWWELSYSLCNAFHFPSTAFSCIPNSPSASFGSSSF